MFQKRGRFFLLPWLALLTACTATGGPSLIEIWNRILWLGRLEWLGYTPEGPLAGFMRIMIFILVFAILYEIGVHFEFLSRNIAIAVSLILAIISSIFIPGSVLTGIGAAYATAVAFILIGVPIAGGLYLFFRLPVEHRWQRFVRFLILLALLAVLLAVKYHATGLASIGPLTIAGPP